MADLNDLAAGALMGLANDAITKDKYDQTTAYALEYEDTGVSQVARTGADGDTLETLSDELDNVLTDIDGLSALTGDAVAEKLAAVGLDMLMYETFDPAEWPGEEDCLMGLLTENDGGVSRFNANALEEAPSGTGGDATQAKQDEILVDLVDIKGSGFVKDDDSLTNVVSDISDLPNETDMKSACTEALEDIHIDHLLGAAYSGEGTAGS
jgi:hypothetical protein